MKYIHRSLTMFGMDNDGFFPSEKLAGNGFDPTHKGVRVLEQLEEHDLLDADQLTDFLSIHGDCHGSWIYFSGQKNIDDASLPLLISPRIGGEVGVLRVGGDVKLEPAENLSALLTSSPATPIAIPATKRK